MLQFQSHTRTGEARDYALLEDNRSYVQNWSIIQIIVIAVTCSVQVKSVSMEFLCKNVIKKV